MMSHPVVLFLLCVSFLSCSSNPGAQTTDVAGKWNGVLSQPSGPLGEEAYTLSLDITQIDSKVLGSSRVGIKDTPYYGLMTLSGHVSGDTLYFAEGGITAERPRPDAHWCVKRGALVYEEQGDSLVGKFEAPHCSGGSIRLQRAK